MNHKVLHYVPLFPKRKNMYRKKRKKSTKGEALGII